jgi:hypothetical protein
MTTKTTLARVREVVGSRMMMMMTWLRQSLGETVTTERESVERVWAVREMKLRFGKNERRTKKLKINFADQSSEFSHRPNFKFVFDTSVDFPTLC